MNPPLTIEERQMFSEIMTQMRTNHAELHTAVQRVDDNLRAHVVQEDGQYDELNERITRLREDVASLKTRWGILASIAGVIGAGVMAALQKVFF